MSFECVVCKEDREPNLSKLLPCCFNRNICIDCIIIIGEENDNIKCPLCRSKLKFNKIIIKKQEYFFNLKYTKKILLNLIELIYYIINVYCLIIQFASSLKLDIDEGTGIYIFYFILTYFATMLSSIFLFLIRNITDPDNVSDDFFIIKICKIKSIKLIQSTHMYFIVINMILHLTLDHGNYFTNVNIINLSNIYYMIFIFLHYLINYTSMMMAYVCSSLITWMALQYHNIKNNFIKEYEIEDADLKLE